MTFFYYCSLLPQILDFHAKTLPFASSIDEIFTFSPDSLTNYAMKIDYIFILIFYWISKPYGLIKWRKFVIMKAFAIS
jgi:hypothetical protein